MKRPNKQKRRKQIADEKKLYFEVFCPWARSTYANLTCYCIDPMTGRRVAWTLGDIGGNKLIKQHIDELQDFILRPQHAVMIEAFDRFRREEIPVCFSSYRTDLFSRLSQSLSGFTNKPVYWYFEISK